MIYKRTTNCTMHLQKEGTARVCKLALRDPGSHVTAPSTFAPLSANLLFCGATLGHSNLVSFSFHTPEATAQPSAERPISSKAGAADQQSTATRLASAGSPQQHGTKTEAAEVQAQQAPEQSEDAAAQPEQKPLPGSIEVPRQRADSGAKSELTSTAGLSRLVQQMGQGQNGMDHGNANTSAGESKDLSATDLQADNGQPGAAAQPGAPQPGAKRPLADASPAADALRNLAEVLTPAAKRPRGASSVPGLGTAEGSQSQLPPLPGLGSGLIPGLGALATPKAVRPAEEDEAPVSDEDAALYEDDDDLEISLYQCAFVAPGAVNASCCAFIAACLVWGGVVWSGLIAAGALQQVACCLPGVAG